MIDCQFWFFFIYGYVLVIKLFAYFNLNCEGRLWKWKLLSEVDFVYNMSNNFDLFSTSVELRPESVWWFAQKNKIDECIIIQVTFVFDYVSFD